MKNLILQIFESRLGFMGSKWMLWDRTREREIFPIGLRWNDRLRAPWRWRTKCTTTQKCLFPDGAMCQRWRKPSTCGTSHSSLGNLQVVPLTPGEGDHQELGKTCSENMCLCLRTFSQIAAYVSLLGNQQKHKRNLIFPEDGEIVCHSVDGVVVASMWYNAKCHTAWACFMASFLRLPLLSRFLE